MFKNSFNSTPSYEKTFIRQAIIDSNLRLDGRGIEDLKQISIHMTRNETSSTSEVTLGTTLVTTIVTGVMIEPFPDKPNEGNLHFNTEFNSYSDTLGVTHAEISRLLERTIRDSDTLDMESLCIVSGEKVWEIRCEVHILDTSGGNIIDACILSAMSALKAFRKPDISIISTEYIGSKTTVSKLLIHHSDDREPLPLSLQHVPLSITLGIIKKTSNSSSIGNSNETELNLVEDKYIFLVDPSKEEEEALDGKISFSINAFNELCAVSKPGGIGLQVPLILKASQICTKKVEYLHQVLKSSLNQLEEQIIQERKRRIEQMRKYKEILLSQRISENDSNTFEDDDMMLSNEVDNDAYGGIARDDPILDWGNLHNPVFLREDK